MIVTPPRPLAIDFDNIDGVEYTNFNQNMESGLKNQKEQMLMETQSLIESLRSFASTAAETIRSSVSRCPSDTNIDRLVLAKRQLRDMYLAPKAA
jgi:hypothetical protein